MNKEIRRLMPRFMSGNWENRLIFPIKKNHATIYETKQITFVILQYNKTSLTIECIESINQIEKLIPIKIIIVDNASTAEEVEKLKSHVSIQSNILLLENEVNTGYADGINLGYKKASEDCLDQLICIMNNDIIIKDRNFIKKIINQYYKSHFSVLGPDIIVPFPHNIHQNPLRYQLRTESDMKRFIRWNKSKIQGLQDSCDTISEHMPGGTRIKDPFNRRNNLVLHGALLVLSPIFIHTFDTALVSGTFLYGEEDLLALRTAYEGLSMVYEPSIKVHHLAGGSSKLGNYVDNKKRRYTNNLIYAELYLKMLEKIMKDSQI